MMHTYLALPDGTRIGYGEPLAGGRVPVAAVCLVDGGFCIAYATVPFVRWTVAEGYSPEELATIEGILAGNAALIQRLAQEAAASSTQPVAEGPSVSPDAVAQEGTATVAGEKPAESSTPQEAPAAEGRGNAAPDVATQGTSVHTGSAVGAGAPKAGAHSQEYRQAAAAVLDAASLVGRVMPTTKVGRLVNTAMPAARTVAAAAPGIVEKAAPVVTQAAGAAAEAAPKVAERAAKGIGRLGSKLAKAAAGAVDGVVGGAKQAAENYQRERGK